MTITSIILLPGLDGTGVLFKPLVGFVLDRLPDSEFVLLGESFSGPIALRVAARKPAGVCGSLRRCARKIAG